MAQKRDRLVAGVADLADAIGVDAADAGDGRAAAARLAKADQGAVLVAEFSELEGYVAAEYARLRGRARGGRRPRWSSTTCPRAPDSPLPSQRRRGPGGRGREDRQPRGRLRGRRGPDRLQGPLRPAPRGPRPGEDRPRPRLGPRPAAAGRLGARAPGGARGPTCRCRRDETAERVFAFLADRFVVPAGRPRAWGRRRPPRRSAPASAASRAPPTWARAIQAARDSAAFSAVWTASTRLGRLARKGPDEATPVTPGDDPGEAALGDAVSAAPAPRSRPRGSAATSRRRWPPPCRSPRRSTGSSRTSWSTPTTRGSGRGGTGWCGRRRGRCRGSRTSSGSLT